MALPTLSNPPTRTRRLTRTNPSPTSLPIDRKASEAHTEDVPPLPAQIDHSGSTSGVGGDTINSALSISRTGSEQGNPQQRQDHTQHSAGVPHLDRGSDHGDETGPQEPSSVPQAVPALNREEGLETSWPLPNAPVEVRATAVPNEAEHGSKVLPTETQAAEALRETRPPTTRQGSLEADGVVQGQETASIPGTMSHGADVPGTEGAEVVAPGVLAKSTGAPSLGTSTPLGHYYVSDDEELSPTSLPRESPLGQGLYSHVSEASGPAPRTDRDDGFSPSSLVSEDADVQDDVFNQPGETYIEEEEVRGIERLHPRVPNVEGEEHIPKGTATTTEPELDEKLSHAVQLLSTPATPEVSGASLKEQKAEDEGLEGAETASLNLQEPEQTPDSHELSSEIESHDEKHDENHDENHESHVHKPVPVEAVSVGHDKDHGVSSEPSEPVPPNAEHGEHGHHSAHQVSHASDQAGSEKDYDTDTDSQRFVTPLPSRHALRALSQQQADLPHTAVTDDYLGNQYQATDDARRYELEHQHTTTVHGEDELFDDTDRSEDHVHPKEVMAEPVNPNQQGTPVLRPAPGREVGTEESSSDNEVAEREASELTADQPVYPQNHIRSRSWVEEMEGYFEEDDEGEPEHAPEISPPQPSTTEHEPGPAASTEAPPESPVIPESESEQEGPQRPETPAGHESLISSEYVTPEALANRDVTNVPWRANNGWTPQSQRTQSTFSSPPTSPLRTTTSKDKHEVAPPLPPSNLATELAATTYHDEPQGSPHLTEQDPFVDEADRKTPVSLAPPWQRHASPNPDFEPSHDGQQHSEGTSGSLFKRMRSIFEQPRSTTSARDSYPGPGPGPGRSHSRPSSGTWFSHHANANAAPSPTRQRPSSYTPPPHLPALNLDPGISTTHHDDTEHASQVLSHTSYMTTSSGTGNDQN